MYAIRSYYVDIADCLSFIETMQSLNEQKAIVGRRALDEKERGQSSKFGRILPIILSAFAGLAGIAMIFLNVGIPRNLSVYIGVGLLASAALAGAIIGAKAGKSSTSGTNLGELKQLEKEYETVLMSYNFV